jgi:RNA polymerase sigma-19 factor, ECF subfamily
MCGCKRSGANIAPGYEDTQNCLLHNRLREFCSDRHRFIVLPSTNNTPASHVNACHDTELVLRLGNDDVAAFDALYNKYHHAIYYNVLKLTRHDLAAEDIVQEVFITLWEKRKTIDPAGVGGWLFVVSYNKAVSWLKKQLKESLSTRLIQEETDELNVAHAAQAMQTEERLSTLQEAIEQLSPQRRRVFELCKMQGKTYEETARELQISRHTVKEYLSAAISGIKEYMQQHYRQEAMGWLLVVGYWLLGS